MKFKIIILTAFAFYYAPNKTFGQNKYYPKSIDTIKCPQSDYKNFQPNFDIGKYKLKCWDNYYRGAIFYFSNLIIKKKAPDSAYYYRAIARVNLNDLLESMYAIEDLNLEITIRPDNYFAFYYRAIAKKQIRQTEIIMSQSTQKPVDLTAYAYPEAVLDLDESIRINPAFEPAVQERKKLSNK
ncbi:hypothetical protein [Ferruginibacter sp. SUN106]|uniref:hypothetical protein n=1 Tax=Ferruginibacter sp. SUN106 TaxID=2978348 RepID=UPI003D360695